MQPRRLLVGTLLAGALVMLAPPAAADPSLSDKETARSLMDDGDAKRDKGDFKAALKSYEAADAIMRVPTTGLEVARAQAQLGLLLEARETLARVMRLPPRPGEPAPFTAARRTAEQLNGDLATRLPSITVVVTNGDPAAPAQIVVDGDPVPPAAAQAPRKVNPGRHSIVARSGAIERKEDVTVAERDARIVTIDLKQPQSASADPSTVEPPREGSRSALPKVLMIGGFAVGAIGIGVGSVTGLMSFSKVSDVKTDCVDDKCKPSRASDIDSARSLGTISTIAFIAGGVGVGVGVVGLILSGKDPKEPTPSSAKLTLTPDVGPTWLGAHGTF